MTPITSQVSDPYMPVSGMIVRRATTCFRSRFLRLLHAGSDPLEADIIQTEVLGIGAQEHASLGDMQARIEFLPLGHDLTLEAGLQFAQTPELDHIAVSDELSRHIGSQIEHGGDLHVVESGLIGDHFAEVVEGDATSVCGRSYLYDLPFELTDAHLSFA